MVAVSFWHNLTCRRICCGLVFTVAKGAQLARVTVFLVMLLWIHSACADFIAGTAFFLNKKGEMLTNRHVVQSCKVGSILVKTSDKVVHRARLLAIDTEFDLAAITIDSPVSAFASVRTVPGSRSVFVTDDVEDVFSSGFSDPAKHNFEKQYRWGQIQPGGSPHAPPYVNILRMDTLPGASGSPVLDYHALLVGVIFASSKSPAYDPTRLARYGYGDKWILIHNLNAIVKFANRYGIQYYKWDQLDTKDPVFIFGHADNVTGLVLCADAR
ncbi:MAG TPA: serine protease [Dongiaceae bacterium]|nr:serine protease [Dongiaceae bacterium]